MSSKAPKNNPSSASYPESVIESEHSPAKMDINLEQPGSLSTLPMAGSETSQQVQQILQQATEILSRLPNYFNDFFQNYRRPITTVGLITLSFVTVKVTLAILSAINEVPLLAPTFELIGMSYSAWFIYRYLLKAVNRDELSIDFQRLREQVLGKENSNS
jgi:CAAD domains of cyanobacterial aminoacyl-tRNA synthetase